MKIFIISLPLIICSAFSVFGQNTIEKTALCTSQTVEKISSRDIRLGISLDEVFNLFAENNKLTTANVAYSESNGKTTVTTGELELQPTLKLYQDYAKKNFGFSYASLSAKNKPNFDGISHYDLGFLDNRLAFFRVHYLKPNWESQEQFIRTVSEIFSLPVRENYLNNSPYFVECGDYTVKFYTSNDEARYSLSVSANVDEIIRQRRKKVEDEQRAKDIKAFKP